MWTNAKKANANKTNASNANEANKANANLANAKEANANETNDGEFNFCRTTTLSSSESFSLLAFPQSPSQNIPNSLLK